MIRAACARAAVDRKHPPGSACCVRTRLPALRTAGSARAPTLRTRWAPRRKRAAGRQTSGSSLLRAEFAERAEAHARTRGLLPECERNSPKRAELADRH